MLRDSGDMAREIGGIPWSDELEPDELQQVFADHLLGLFTEVGEVAECVGWKSWTDNPGFIDRKALTDELADVLRFTLNIASFAGVQGHELSQAFNAKQAKLHERVTAGYSQRRHNADG